MTAPKHETADEWAKRVLEEHGPLPPRITDLIGRLRAKHANDSTTQRKRTA